ncbi:iron-containing alcohol dehydrogenase [Photobacterium indicum]|uniref:Alcohol dehydrogenase n=1 Tax=Photobacterium indicum TaxID=81447 RepID=A0A2T3L5E7_9GAMM|nr:iron-containing alcohol dehydrogenase [Photobacterium indicum]PSV45127.1 alcohol dehydrogenase [Photobacterium indicum]
MLHGNWNYPTSISVGVGCVNEIPKVCQELGIQSPLLVTDPGLAHLPVIQAILKDCHNAELTIHLFSKVQSNPTGNNVDDGVKAFNAGRHDGVIAFGGGSSIDTAKAIALVAKQIHSLWDFEDVGDNWKRAITELIAPIIAIPTTAGTGSEVGRASVITDQEEQVKKIIFHPKMLPLKVLLDPNVTLTLPAEITAATGMDALSHNLEALCSPSYHPMAEGIALEGIRLIKEYLPIAYHNGHDIDARTQMLVASSMGATSFQKGLGGMHAIAHTLGALYNKHHGLLNAILMPYVMVANRREIELKMTRVGSYIALRQANFDGVLEWVLQLRKDLGIPHTLSAIGIDTLQRELVGKMSVSDASASSNPIKFNAEQYSIIFSNAVKGTL